MNGNAYQRNDGEQLKVASKDDQITTAPERRVTIQISIRNESPNEDRVDVLVKGVPPGWIIIHTPVVHLAAGEEKLVTLTIQPQGIPENCVGQYVLDVHAASQSDPNHSAVAHSVLTVAAYQLRGRIGVMLLSFICSVNYPAGLVDETTEYHSLARSHQLWSGTMYPDLDCSLLPQPIN